MICRAVAAVNVAACVFFLQTRPVRMMVRLCCSASPAAATVANAVASTGVFASVGVFAVGSADVVEAAGAIVHAVAAVVVVVGGKRWVCLLAPAFMPFCSTICPSASRFRQKANLRWAPCCIC